MSTPDEDAGPPPIRIGHQEREAAYKALSTHLDAGRLDAEEYGERYAKASFARTRPELEELFIDLPEPHAFPEVPVPEPRPYAYQHPGFGAFMPKLLRIVPVLVLVLVVATQMWAWFVIVPVSAVLFGGRRGPWHHHGHGRNHWR